MKSLTKVNIALNIQQITCFPQNKCGTATVSFKPREICSSETTLQGRKHRHTNQRWKYLPATSSTSTYSYCWLRGVFINPPRSPQTPARHLPQLQSLILINPAHKSAPLRENTRDLSQALLWQNTCWSWLMPASCRNHECADCLSRPRGKGSRPLWLVSTEGAMDGAILWGVGRKSGLGSSVLTSMCDPCKPCVWIILDFNKAFDKTVKVFRPFCCRLPFHINILFLNATTIDIFVIISIEKK